MHQAVRQPDFEVVMLGPRESGKTLLLARTLIALGAFHPRIVERYLGTQREYGCSFAPIEASLVGLVRQTREERERGITVYTTHYRGSTRKWSICFTNTAAPAFFARTCIRAAATADVAMLVVSLESGEFERCMNGRGKNSLFEAALIAKGVGIEQVIVVLTKADQVESEVAKQKQATADKDVEKVMHERWARVVELLLFMKFKRDNIQAVFTSATSNKGISERFFKGSLSLVDALDNIRVDQLPHAQQRRAAQQEKSSKLPPPPPFRHVVHKSHRVGGIGTVVCGKVVSGTWHLENRNYLDSMLAYYPRDKPLRVRPVRWCGQDRDKEMLDQLHVGSGESFHENLTSAEAGTCLSIRVRMTSFKHFHPGMVGMSAKENSETALELTVAEFTASVRVVSHPSAAQNQTLAAGTQEKGRKVALSVGQVVTVHAHAACVPCKVMAIMRVQRGNKVLTGRVLHRARVGDVAEVRLRPESGLVVAPFAKFPGLARVLLRDGITLAFGRVVRVARVFKDSFLKLVPAQEEQAEEAAANQVDQMWAQLEAEPDCLVSRDRDNNTLLHLFLDRGREDLAARLMERVEQRLGRVALQRLLRVRNRRGETAIYLALSADRFDAAASLLAHGSPFMPSAAEQERLRRLWKKTKSKKGSAAAVVASPLDILSHTHDGKKRQALPNLALLCLLVLTRDRDEYTNLEEMLPMPEMYQLYAIALRALAASNTRP